MIHASMPALTVLRFSTSLNTVIAGLLASPDIYSLANNF